jgi:hypothetical protein
MSQITPSGAPRSVRVDIAGGNPLGQGDRPTPFHHSQTVVAPRSTIVSQDGSVSCIRSSYAVSTWPASARVGSNSPVDGLALDLARGISREDARSGAARSATWPPATLTQSC